tara:strand:- start:3835 stop:4551 length:717 start_codon:yes stop_codon:yes gene_type:complete
MANWEKWLWGGLGWAMFGPIGGIMGYALGSTDRKSNSYYNQKSKTQPGDFGAVLLILFASVMKADNELKKTELNYVKSFIINQFGKEYAKDRIKLFQKILVQDYPLKDICNQVKLNMDHSARLQMIHVLFGLSKSDGHIHVEEIKVINRISDYFGISNRDFESIKAMFIEEINKYYKILEISKDASDNEIKKSYRRMASKFHPDKVHHLGEDFQKMAEEKFKMVNEAYSKIKLEKNLK